MSARPCRSRPLLALVLASLPVVARAHAPHDVITELAVSPAFAVDGTLFATITLTDVDMFVRSTDGGRSWTYFGTPMAAPAVSSFAFSPDFAADRTAFASSKTTGLWRTTDGGDSWQPAGAGLTTSKVTAVAVSPDFVLDRRVLAATDQGVFVSLDGAENWAPSNTGLVETDLACAAMTFDGNGPVCFVAGQMLHVSYDRGQSWTLLGEFAKRAVSLAVDPLFVDSPRVLVSFGGGGLGVALSTDGGLHFETANDGLTDLFVHEVAIAVDGTLFAASEVDGCFRSAGPGVLWELIADGFEHPSELTRVHNTEVVPSPDFAVDRTVFVGSFEGMYRSVEGGDDWRQLDVYSQLLNRCIVFSPDFAADAQILFGNYGGSVFHYSEMPPPPPPTVPGASAGAQAFASSAAKSARVGPASPPTTVVPQPGLEFAWEPRGTGLKSPWSSLLVASPGAVGRRTLAYAYVGFSQSTDEGLSWTNVPKPAPITVVRALAFSPGFEDDGIAFIGSLLQGSYRSSGGLQSWELLTGLPEKMSTTSIAVSPAFLVDGLVYYSSRDMGLYRSQDGGSAWAPANSGLPSTELKIVALSPDFAVDHFLLAGHIGEGVWASNDAGDSWLEANGGLPDATLSVDTLAFSPDFATDRTVFAGLRDQGVWVSHDGAQTWQPTGTGVPAPPVMLAVSPTFTQDHTVVVGTFDGTVVSRDAGATWDPLPGYVRVDDTHPNVHYEGTWTASVAAEAFVGGLMQTETSGDLCELEFFGDYITWRARRDPTGAIAQVQVDDGPLVDVDTWAEQPEAQVAVFTRTFHEAGWHVIRVRHSGTANPAATGLVLASDGFEYEW